MMKLLTDQKHLMVFPFGFTLNGLSKGLCRNKKFSNNFKHPFLVSLISLLRAQPRWLREEKIFLEEIQIERLSFPRGWARGESESRKLPSSTFR